MLAESSQFEELRGLRPRILWLTFESIILLLPFTLFRLSPFYDNLGDGSLLGEFVDIDESLLPLVILGFLFELDATAFALPCGGDRAAASETEGVQCQFDILSLLEDLRDYEKGSSDKV